ncbi:MAG: FkbM family methyltransferase, partial [Anaerolineae bacterium]
WMYRGLRRKLDSRQRQILEKGLEKRLSGIKAFIKSMPVIGNIARRIYGIFLFVGPKGQYWEYNFKAKKFSRLIRGIASLIGNKGYKVVIDINGNAHIVLENGIMFWWIPGDPMSLLGMPLRGSFEPECTFLLTKLLKRGDIAFDIGANFGWYSYHLAQLVGEAGKVHIFEPTSALDELKNNLTLNKFEARCVLNQVALGEKEGTEALFIPEKLGTAFASLREHSYGKTRKTCVPVQRLDDYVNANKIRDVAFVKIDVEGAEHLVLKGAENVLTRYSPVIMLEIQKQHTEHFGYSPQQLISYLGDFGYHLFEIDKDKFGSVKKVGAFNDTHNYNFLAVKNADALETRGISVI